MATTSGGVHSDDVCWHASESSPGSLFFPTVNSIRMITGNGTMASAHTNRNDQAHPCGHLLVNTVTAHIGLVPTVGAAQQKTLRQFASRMANLPARPLQAPIPGALMPR